jgi:OmpA-OmpF porin, OOP family
LRESSFEVLNKLKDYLEKNKNVKIELSAHTDCIGSHESNNRLSQQRAESCKQHLLKLGIDSSRITAKGYGKTRMIIEDCELQKADDSAAQKNRRVEVKIL